MKRISKAKHQWLRDRNMQGAFLVLRLDDYDTTPLGRGQFVHSARFDDNRKAVWPTYEQALGAAKWAVEKFGHQYGVFSLSCFVEHANQPVKVTKVRNG